MWPSLGAIVRGLVVGIQEINNKGGIWGSKGLVGGYG